MTTQHELATRFHGLHDPAAPLALANVWDVASARIVAASGAAAIATTSAGVAWGLGAADGNRLDRKLMLETLARIVAAVDLPVTADIESGFGDTPGVVAHCVAQVLQTGTVGVNIEDSQPGATSPEQSLRPIVEQARRIEAARAAADSAPARRR
jgi:2-methylisocitrate lyase-like PEP mutase family enzyme